jgi:hypothetical protein
VQCQQGKRSYNRTRKHASPKPEDPTQLIYEMHIIVKGLAIVDRLGWLLLIGCLFVVVSWMLLLVLVEKRLFNCNLYIALGKRVYRAL